MRDKKAFLSWMTDPTSVNSTLKTAYRRINHRDMICQTSKPNNSEELIDKQRKKDVTLYIERERSS